MTRARLYGTIRERLADFQLPCDGAAKEVVDAAVDTALEYVLSFAVEVAEELAAQPDLYSEAMVAGVFVRKLKGLLGDG